MVVTITCLPILKAFGAISYPDISVKVLRGVFPLPILFLGNTVTGLVATKGISVPMYACLRRFSILFLLLGEKYFLHQVHSTRIRLCVFAMIIGAIVAASDDLTFNLWGYISIMFCNMFTASNGIVIKLKLSKPDVESQNQDIQKKLGTWGLMFYNALISVPVLAIILFVLKHDEVASVAHFSFWNHKAFLTLFMLSGVMGTLIQFSIFYCTKINGPLTTGIIGSLKNVLSTFLGILLPGMGYIYSVINFGGVSLSLIASLVYTHEKLAG